MKALVYEGPGKVACQEIPCPDREPGQVVVKISYCGVCGGDMGIFAGTHPRAAAPLVLGHEFVGHVVEAGPDSPFSHGERVVPFPLVSCGHCVSCRNGIPHICQSLRLVGIDSDGGMAQYAKVDEKALVRVDPALGDEVAALIEPLAVVVRAVHQSRIRFLDTAVVMGAGPIGILNALVLKRCGASRIIVSDMAAPRLRLCERLGLEAVDITKHNLAGYVEKATGGDGVDVVFECSGTEAATFEATRLAKMEGTICMTGMHKAPHTSNLPEFSFKEQTLVATRVYTREAFERAAGLAVEMREELSQLVSHRIPLERAAEAFDLIKNHGADTVKVLIDCRG